MPMRIFENRNRSGRLPGHVRRRRGDVRDVLLHHLLRPGRHATSAPLQDRLRVPAGRVRHRHHLAGRRAAAAAARAQAAADRSARSCSPPRCSGSRRVDAELRLLRARCCPGMVVLAVGMGCLFVPLTSTAVPSVRQHRRRARLGAAQRRPAGRRRARACRCMTTVFGTAGAQLRQRPLGSAAASSWPVRRRRPVSWPGPSPGASQQAGSNGLQPDGHQRSSSAACRPRSRPTAPAFFDGPLPATSPTPLAHASGQGFLTGAVFGVVAIIAAVVLIKVKKTDLPTDPGRRGRPRPTG